MLSNWAKFAVLLPLLAAACGFQPLYGGIGSGRDTANVLAEVEVTIIADRTGQQLRNELLDRLNPRGRPANPAYSLRVTLQESVQRLAIRRDDTPTLASLTLTAGFELVSLSQSEPVLSGSVRSVNSYDISQEEFATVSAERDARTRAATDLADGITARVAVFLADL